MDESNPTKKKLSLEELFSQRIVKNDEAEAIGELLYAIQRTEYLVTLLIGFWAFPLRLNRFDYLIDNLLMKLPWQDKFKFLEIQGILDKNDLGALQQIFQNRNFLAHPRSTSKSVTE